MCVYASSVQAALVSLCLHCNKAAESTTVEMVDNLVDVVKFEISEKQQQQCRDGFDDDLLMSVDVDTKSH